MNSLTLKHLRAARALAAHGHFGRAAEAIGITQPALSMQIRDLEAETGLPLFERGPRMVRPTPFGAAFMERAQPILQAVDDLGDLARAARERLAGRLGLGIIPTVAPYLLPRIVAALSTAHPDLDLQLRETQTQTLLSELAVGRIDTAIVALPVSEPSLVEVPLLSEDFVLVRPEADADAPVPDAATLAGLRLLLLEEGHCFRDQALSFCASRTRSPRENLEGSALSTLVQMVGAGLGVTLLPEMAVPIETRAAAVSVARFPDPAPGRRVGMVWRRTGPLAGQLAPISETLRAALAPEADPPRARPKVR